MPVPQLRECFRVVGIQVCERPKLRLARGVQGFFAPACLQALAHREADECARERKQHGQNDRFGAKQDCKIHDVNLVWMICRPPGAEGVSAGGYGIACASAYPSTRAPGFPVP
jgi:hypothetical protein